MMGQVNSPIHRQVVVDTVQQEMQHQRPVGVRQEIINMEQESVKTIFKECPDEVSQEETGNEFGE